MLPSGKILIVDDEPRMCESLRTLLVRQGHDVRTANSGHEAQEELSTHQFDLALLDMMMPDMNGHQLMDYINQRTPETLVIMMTGRPSVDSAIGALRRGAYDYVRKPFEFDELVTTVGNALTQKRLKIENEIIHGKLELTEERYRHLVENSPDIIYTLDEGGHFTFVSDASEHLLGYNRDQLMGKHYSTIIYEGDLDKAKWFFSERRTGDQAAIGVELRLKTSSNNEKFRPFEIKHISTVLKPSGINRNDEAGEANKFEGIQGVARDISDRRKLERQLEQAQKMEAIGTLAGGIAHDFNNLLMGIQGYASLMLLKTEEAHFFHEKLKNIEKYVKSGAELTKQLLGFAGTKKSDIKSIHVNGLVESTAKMFWRTRKEISIDEEYEENIWSVDGNQVQLEQVLLNLFVNASQAMPSGGIISLKTENVSLKAVDVRQLIIRPGDYVKISVIDNGMGMEDETLKRIFEPFFTTKTKEKGTGLGLASAYGIIKNHNGIIDVTSKKGKGTTFHLYLPASKKEVKKENNTAEDVIGGEETVLLVDDENATIDTGTTILEEMGYKVVTARNGREALDIYSSNKGEIDIVVLDIVMPHMGGEETYDGLKRIDPNVKVLLSSGYSVGGKVNEILAKGCQGFIQKPFDINGFCSKLRGVLDEKVA